MAIRKITVFYAWQSDTPGNIGRNFIRKALDDAADRMNSDPSLSGLTIAIDADTEGEVGTPPVTETILRKIGKADIFAPDLTFVAKTDGGKLIPNPNVMVEYGYALRALSFEAMMPVMNTHYGPPAEAAGRGLGIVGSVLNPGLIVIGGALARAGGLFVAPLEASFNKHTLVKRTDVGTASQTRFVISKFADNDACLGAVGLVLQHHAGWAA
jgi:hypothetical protein